MKVNLAQVRELEIAYLKAQEAYFQATSEIFCDKCGEKNPESGFYPLGIHGPGSISGLLCNGCARNKGHNNSPPADVQ